MLLNTLIGPPGHGNPFFHAPSRHQVRSRCVCMTLSDAVWRGRKLCYSHDSKEERAQDGEDLCPCSLPTRGFACGKRRPRPSIATTLVRQKLSKQTGDSPNLSDELNVSGSIVRAVTKVYRSRVRVGHRHA
jgi:hypothetical protein